MLRGLYGKAPIVDRLVPEIKNLLRERETVSVDNLFQAMEEQFFENKPTRQDIVDAIEILVNGRFASIPYDGAVMNKEPNP